MLCLSSWLEASSNTGRMEKRQEKEKVQEGALATGIGGKKKQRQSKLVARGSMTRIGSDMGTTKISGKTKNIRVSDKREDDRR